MLGMKAQGLFFHGENRLFDIAAFVLVVVNVSGNNKVILLLPASTTIVVHDRC